jgi:ubiquitin carboxyl-terminal hydrolase 9/24
MNMLQENVKETGDSQVDEAVLEGHLGIAKELLSFMSPEKKYELGSDEKKGISLVKVYCYLCTFFIHVVLFYFLRAKSVLERFHVQNTSGCPSALPE